MGILEDIWNRISEFFEIRAVEPIVPESKEPPKPLEPAKSETTLPEKPSPEAPIEPVEPLPSEPLPSQIGEEGKRRRIEKPPAKPEPEAPFVEPPSEEDYPANIQFFVKEAEPEPAPTIAGADVTFLGQTKTTDSTGQCSISGRMKIMKNYPITASKAGYRTTTDEISFASAPHPVYGSGYLGATKILYMERL